MAVATSRGTVCLCTVDTHETGSILHLQTFSVFPVSTLTLSLAWAHLPSHSDAIAASSSDGRIAVFDTKSQDPEIEYQCHDDYSREVWTVAWTSECPEPDATPQLVSGGDDDTFCRYPLCVEPVNGDGSHEYELDDPLRDKKSHDAGVTALLPLLPISHSTQLVLTGSYDENVRLLWLVDDYEQPGILATKSLGGGVWSLKQLYYTAPKGDVGASYMVLASCMHAGPKILQVRRKDNGEWEINVLAKNVEHESMNYASAGRPIYGRTGLESFLIVSTSFYDKKLCVWRVEMDDSET